MALGDPNGEGKGMVETSVVVTSAELTISPQLGPVARGGQVRRVSPLVETETEVWGCWHPILGVQPGIYLWEVQGELEVPKLGCRGTRGAWASEEGMWQ